MSAIDDLDIRIEELSSREPTSENLNLLGDLYLRKGDKRKAIECFYTAARKAYVQKKIIAIYKKILKISPLEVDAIEGLADVYAKGGYVAEEIQCLEKLAQTYERRGELTKAHDVYRRIHDLDLENKVASSYFAKGRPSFEDNGEEDKEFVRYRGQDYSGEEGLRADAGIRDSDRKTVGEEGATVSRIEEALRKASATRERGDHRHSWKKSVLLSTVVICSLLLVTGISLYILKKGKGGEKVSPAPSTAVQSPAGDVVQGTTAVYRGDAFSVEAARLTDEAAAQVQPAGISEDERRRIILYLVKITALKGCIPEDFMGERSQHVFFTGKGGGRIPSFTASSLNIPERVIFKSGVCGKARGIVFAHFYVAHPRGENTTGVLLEQLDRSQVIAVKWN